MPKPFDAATKYLVERQPADWLEYLGFARGPVTVIEAELSTVTAAADRVLRVEEPDPWLLHLELQASYDRDLVGRMLEYHVLLWRRSGLGVRSAVVLLRPEADQPALTGSFDLPLPGGSSELGLRYPRDLTAELLRGVRAMKESVTYQAILEEGREEGREMGREEGREMGRV